MMNITKYKSTMAAIILLVTAFITLGQAQTRDEKLAKANSIFVEAFGLFNQGTVESYQAAFVKFQQASRIYQEIGEKSKNAGLSLVVSGVISDLLGEKASALKFYDQALKFFRKIKDIGWEATASQASAWFIPIWVKTKKHWNFTIKPCYFGNSQIINQVRQQLLVT